AAIAGADPGRPVADLEPFRATVGSARVVGLGEAVHGAHELLQMKHRLLAFLVDKLGFSVVALEADAGAAQAAADFVATGRGAAAAAAAARGAPGDSGEVAAVVAWLRAWNAAPRHRKKLRLAGIDVVRAQAPAAAVRAYLGKVGAPAEPALDAV